MGGPTHIADGTTETCTAVGCSICNRLLLLLLTNVQVSCIGLLLIIPRERHVPNPDGVVQRKLKGVKLKQNVVLMVPAANFVAPFNP